MKANRIHRFGPPEVIVIDDIARPTPKPDELVVRVAAAGVGPWDALIREHKSAVNISLPVILGSDLASVVDSVGSAVTQFKPGDEVYGVTNKDFCGAYAEYAVDQAKMIAPKRSL
jgi:NADPH:quinone reductase-like Zn-dependent oxidoreductase